MKWRRVVSLSMFFFIIVASYTGIGLYIAPHGRVAYWSNWYFLGLSKEEYGEIHTVASILFMFLAIFHIWYNWGPIKQYMRKKAGEALKMPKELLVSTSVIVLVVLLTYFRLPPMVQIVQLGDFVKDTWAERLGEPPYGHAELSNLKQFSKKTGIDLTSAMARLREKGIDFSGKDDLKTIAIKNNMTPKQILDLMRDLLPRERGALPETGVGRMTIGSVAKALGISPDVLISQLEEKGVKGAQAEMKVKDVAYKNGFGHPHELVLIIKKLYE